MATITVAICARNAADIIGDCLTSIAAQTVTPDCVLVAVDEPDDPTIAVAEKHGARVIVAHSTGLYEARNAVLDACETAYLAFTDADCVLVPEWVERAKGVLDARPDVAGGTGRHPAIGTQNLASWLHHMWFVVETERTGETEGIIGGNSYFRTGALRDVGGWLPLSGHSAAEDMYIAHALRTAGHSLWFEEGVAAQHHYETRLCGLWRKAVMMGKDIVVMMRAAGIRNGLWWYTLAIPCLAGMAVIGALFALTWSVAAGAAIAAVPLLLTFAFLAVRFRSVSTAAPRWVARWLLIWPYSLGILKGLAAPIPDGGVRRRDGDDVRRQAA
jgi:glycosyltransferase involved in cell wall biosynthesis